MCGIVGFLSQRRPPEREALERAVRALHHRGPDERQVWIGPEKDVGLGHARLSIIDLSTGTQPIGNEDGSIQIVVNGEFYDFERIRRELEEKGHRFRTRSDSEIALHLYEEHGVRFLEHLRGEFAFILWDQRNRTLLAARDRIGIKPLLYAIHDGALYLASEAKAIQAAGVPLRWDEGSFFHCMQAQYIHYDRTLFAGVHQLRPGYYLLATDGHIQTHRYWDHDYPRLDGGAPELDRTTATEMLRDKLDEAIRLRLRADVPVACFLSGGLDSSAVAGFAQRQMSRPLACFTVCFEDAEYDEWSVAEATAKAIGADFRPCRVSRRELLAALPDAIYHAEGLAVNGHLAAKFLLSRWVRDAGFKVVLTGEGSDEVLAGYPHFRADLWSDPSASGESSRLLERLHDTNRVSSGLLLPEGETISLARLNTVLGFAPSFLQAKGSLGLRNLELLTADFSRRFAERDPFDLLLLGLDVSGQIAGRHRVNQAAYLWLKVSFPNYLLRMMGDGSEMAHSIEGRVPFLDHHFAALTHSLPIHLKIDGGIEKAILREAARPVLTDEVYKREKKPLFSPPLTGTAENDVEPLFQDLLRGSALAAVPFYDQRKVVAVLDRLPSMTARERIATDASLMMALSAAVIQERFRL